MIWLHELPSCMTPMMMRVMVMVMMKMLMMVMIHTPLIAILFAACGVIIVAAVDTFSVLPKP